MAVTDDLTEYDSAICRLCGEGLVVRSVRTGRFWTGPFWRLAWTHADPQYGTDGTTCWSPPAQPDPATIRRVAEIPAPILEEAGS